MENVFKKICAIEEQRELSRMTVTSATSEDSPKAQQMKNFSMSVDSDHNSQDAPELGNIPN